MPTGHYKFFTLPVFFSLILIIIISFVTFSSVTTFDFINIDDNVYVSENPHIRDGLTQKNIQWAFQADLIKTSKHSDYWQPITMISRMIDIELFDLDAGGHHLMNLVWHTLNSILLFLLFMRLGGHILISFVATLVFTIHPIQVEAIAWITARKDVLSLFWMLIGLHSYLSFHKTKSFPQLFMTWIIFIIGLMTKPSVIVLPLLMMCFDLFLPKETDLKLSLRSIGMLLIEKWVFFLTSVCYIPIPFIGQPRAFDHTPLSETIKHVSLNILFYLKQFILWGDFGLHAPSPMETVSTPKSLMALCIFLLVTTLVWVFRKKTPYLILGWVWFIVTLLPVVGLVYPSDRFMYVPMIGLLMTTILACQPLLTAQKYKISFLGLIVIFLIVLFVKTKKILPHWRNSEQVCRQAVKLNPSNFLAHTNLGMVLEKDGKTDQAVYHYQKSIEAEPRYVKPHINLARHLSNQGKTQQAKRLYHQVLSLDPDHVEANNNYGSLLASEGDYMLARKHLRKALSIDPEYFPAKFNLNRINALSP